MSASPPFGSEQVAVLSAAQTRAWDRAAVEGAGIPERVLMESAGRAAAAVVQHCFPEGRVVAIAGAGNNGGDALVLLRALRAWGRDVAVAYVGERPEPRLLHGWEIPVLDGDDPRTLLQGAATVVDGILGTGASGAPRLPAAVWIRAINACGAPVVALDGPSGVDLTTGAVPGEAVRADVTVAFGALKAGLLRFPGRGCAGRILGVEVGFPPYEPSLPARLVTAGWAHRRLPRIAPDAHKGTTGTVAVVAGRRQMAGAAVMVGAAALRAGAGMVRLVADAAVYPILQTALPEGVFTERDSPDLEERLEAAAAVVAGPAMGTGDAEARLLRRVVAAGSAPLLLDADALTLLAREPELLANNARPTLLTPHPGEMGRLLGCSVAEVTADPEAAAHEAAKRWECAVLLKGAPSLVVGPGQETRFSASGHSGIATGGMGDTLAGVAGALLALGCAPAEAGALALFFSGRAAEIAGRGRGLLPRDVAEALPAALEEKPTPVAPFPGVFVDLPPPR
jgi:NAD(P)H-hydrate epimerase